MDLHILKMVITSDLMVRLMNNKLDKTFNITPEVVEEEKSKLLKKKNQIDLPKMILLEIMNILVVIFIV